MFTGVITKRLSSAAHRNYHKALVQCLASGGQTAHTGNFLSLQKTPSKKDKVEKSQPETVKAESVVSDCGHLNFSTVPPGE